MKDSISEDFGVPVLQQIGNQAPAEFENLVLQRTVEHKPFWLPFAVQWNPPEGEPCRVWIKIFIKYQEGNLEVSVQDIPVRMGARMFHIRGERAGDVWVAGLAFPCEGMREFTLRIPASPPQLGDLLFMEFRSAAAGWAFPPTQFPS